MSSISNALPAYGAMGWAGFSLGLAITGIAFILVNYGLKLGINFIAKKWLAEKDAAILSDVLAFVISVVLFAIVLSLCHCSWIVILIAISVVVLIKIASYIEPTMNWLRMRKVCEDIVE